MDGFYQYLVYLIIGIALLSFVPDNAKVLVMGIVVLGGLAYIETHGGTVNLLNDLHAGG